MFGGQITSLACSIADLRRLVEGEINELHSEMDELSAQWDAHRRVTSPPSTSTANTGAHALKVLKPVTFDGTRNATMENFLVGLEQYFNALRVTNDYFCINNAPTFLCDTVQL